MLVIDTPSNSNWQHIVPQTCACSSGLCETHLHVPAPQVRLSSRELFAAFEVVLK